MSHRTTSALRFRGAISPTDGSNMSRASPSQERSDPHGAEVTGIRQRQGRNRRAGGGSDVERGGCVGTFHSGRVGCCVEHPRDERAPHRESQDALDEDEDQQQHGVCGDECECQPPQEQEGSGHSENQTRVPVGEPPGGSDAEKRSDAEHDQGQRYPHLVQSCGLTDDGCKEGERREGPAVDKRSEQHCHEQSGLSELREFEGQRRAGGGPFRCRLRAGPDPREDADGGGDTQQRDCPEGRSPPHRGAEQCARRDACDDGDRRTGKEGRQGTPLLIRGHETGRGAEGDGQEAGVGNRSQDTGCEQHGEGRGCRGDDVAESEDHHASGERGPCRPPTCEGSHEGCADDHPDREGGGEQSGGPDGDIEARGDVGHEAGEHEFRRAHGEDREGEQMQSERHRVTPRHETDRRRLVATANPVGCPNNRPHARSSRREAGTSVVQGLTAWPKAPEVSDSGLDMGATLPMAARRTSIFDEAGRATAACSGPFRWTFRRPRDAAWLRGLKSYLFSRKIDPCCLFGCSPLAGSST